MKSVIGLLSLTLLLGGCAVHKFELDDAAWALRDAQALQITPIAAQTPACEADRWTLVTAGFYPTRCVRVFAVTDESAGAAGTAVVTTQQGWGAAVLAPSKDWWFERGLIEAQIEERLRFREEE